MEIKTCEGCYYDKWPTSRCVWCDRSGVLKEGTKRDLFMPRRKPNEKPRPPITALATQAAFDAVTADDWLVVKFTDNYAEHSGCKSIMCFTGCRKHSHNNELIFRSRDNIYMNIDNYLAGKSVAKWVGKITLPEEVPHASEE